MKRKYLVHKQPRDGEQSWNVSGPFVVVARNPLHAARVARHRWPAYLSNHVRVETHALEVRQYGESAMVALAFISDRRGQLIPSSARYHA
jgi:hypothetical protein